MTKKERPLSKSFSLPSSFVLSLLVLLLSPVCFAGTYKLGLETEFGRGYLGSEFSITHASDQAPTDAWHFSSWSAWLAANQSKFRSGTSNEFQVQRGLDLSVGLAFDYRDFFNLDVYLYHSKTNESGYRQTGAELRGTFYFGEQNLEEDAPDQRSYLGLGFGSSQIQQDFDADLLAPGLDPHLRMQSDLLEFTAGGSLSKSWALEAVFDRQFYSKSKEDLEELEPNPNAQFNSIDLTSSISELTVNSASLQISFHPESSSDWELALKGKESHLLIDGSSAREIRLTGTYFYEKSQASLGLVQWTSFGEVEYTVVTNLMVAF